MGNLTFAEVLLGAIALVTFGMLLIATSIIYTTSKALRHMRDLETKRKEEEEENKRNRTHRSLLATGRELAPSEYLHRKEHLRAIHGMNPPPTEPFGIGLQGMGLGSFPEPIMPQAGFSNSQNPIIIGNTHIHSRPHSQPRTSAPLPSSSRVRDTHERHQVNHNLDSVALITAAAVVMTDSNEESNRNNNYDCVSSYDSGAPSSDTPSSCD